MKSGKKEKGKAKMKNALETIPDQMWRRLNKLDLDELIPPKWTIIVNETGVQVIRDLLDILL